MKREGEIKDCLNAVAHVQSALRNHIMVDATQGTLTVIDLLLDGMRVGVLDALDAIGDTGASGALEDILTRLAEDIGADL